MTLRKLSAQYGIGFRPFKPIGPRGKALAALLVDRVHSAGGVVLLDADADGRPDMHCPRQHRPYHGRVTRYDEIDLYYRFYIKGVAFERKCKGYQCTGGPVFVSLGGVRYRIAAWGAPWPV